MSGHTQDYWVRLIDESIDNDPCDLVDWVRERYPQLMKVGESWGFEMSILPVSMQEEILTQWHVEKEWYRLSRKGGEHEAK